jgi:hypothetical protein
MATIREISKKTGVGVWTLRKLVKAGIFKADDDNAATEKIRLTLARGNPLSVAQLVELVDDPTLAHDLGRYAERAKAQVAALGEVRSEAAPFEVAAYIDEASNGNADATRILAGWIREIVPAAGSVHFSWIAARLVWNSRTRADDIARVSLALINARKELAGWWRIEKIKGRPQTFFARPKIPLDL